MATRSDSIRRTSALLFAVAFTSLSAEALELEDIVLVRGQYENPIHVEAPVSNGVSTAACTLFSGNVGPTNGLSWDPQADAMPPEVPKDGGGNYLLQSSVGWPTPATVGWVDRSAEGLPGTPKNAVEALAHDGYQHLMTIQDIFDTYYQNAEPTDPESIYLAYDFILTDDQGDRLVSQNGEARFILPDGTHTNAEVIFDKTASDEAKRNLFVARSMDPHFLYRVDGTTVRDIRDLLLDVPYFESVSLMLRGNLALERAFCVRFLDDLQSPLAETIDIELEKLGWNRALDAFDPNAPQGAWGHFSKASTVWLGVFSSPIQLQYLQDLASVRTLNYASHTVFQTAPPTGLRPSGAPWPPLVYEGYKDVAAMFRALAQRARVVHEVARRLVLKLQREHASALIEKHVQQISIEEGVIMSLLLPGGMPADHETKYPGMAESLAGLRDVMSQLGQLRAAAVNARLNALGFDNEVLFIRSVEPGSGDRTLYTYDWLVSQLFDLGGNPINMLGKAYENDELAKQARLDFELKASQYLSEFDSIEDEYDQQLIAICGRDPTDLYKPNLANPEEGGGLLEQQRLNVDIAANAIERVQRLMANVRARIENEQDRVARINNVSDKRIKIIYQTGQATGDLTREIAGIQGQMALANSMTQATASLMSATKSPPLGVWGGIVSAAAQAANGMVQARLHRKIGEKQAAIIRLQTEQQASFEYLSQEINDVESETHIKNMFLELRTLEIDMLDAELRYAQELKRLAQYYTEIENKVMRRDRSLDRMTRRSFSDPAYRIEVTKRALAAEDSFQIAQTWVYLLGRALDYKWPTGDFALRLLLQQVIMARTAERLESLVNDMRIYNLAQQSNPGAAYYYWNYSLRKDYLGMRYSKEMPPPDGRILTPVEQFREYLTGLTNDTANIVEVDGAPHLVVPFSTVKFDIADDNTGSTDLLDSEGTLKRGVTATPIFKTGLWDSKIDWVQLDVIGSDVYPPNPQAVEVFLWYGGSGFVRTGDDFLDPGGSGNLLDFLVYPNPAYNFNYVPGGRGFGWDVHPYVKQKMTAKLVTNPRNIPDFVFKNEAFRERPVAATDWRLLIPVDGTNLENIRDVEVNILYTARTIQ